MNVKIKILDEKAQVPFKTHQSDFCYDLVATSEEEIAPNVWKYGFGIALEAETVCNGDYQCLGFDIRPRSSIYKTGMVLSNSCGTVDVDYRGEISAIFYHVMPNFPRYKVGDKIAQLCVMINLPIQFVVTDELSETERGTGGYGSTGK